MKRNDLFIKNDIIYRILYIDEPRVLIIDCIKKCMPYWIHNKFLEDSKQITEEELLEATGVNLDAFKSLSVVEQAEAQKIWKSISNIVLVIHKDAERKIIFKTCCEEYNVSRDTIRTRLCNYLVYQNIAILIKRTKFKKSRELTDDEKNFRWALNKYYYTGLQLSIAECYRRMLKDKYCDENGKLLNEVPSLRRFRFYFDKTVKKENLIISRNGKGEYMRNHRVLLGDGVREFCPAIGYGMMDSTICDIFLVNDKGELLGRPVMTACVDAYSSMCLGYSLGWEGGINSLKSLVNNIICDKVEHCKKFGIDIDINDWNCNKLPFKLITDRGREYIGDTFSQLTDLGVEMINLPPYRPELKGMVEKFFDLIQSYFRKELASKGVIFEDYQERGGVDYRKKACLTLDDFEKIVLLCIIHYNTKRIIDLPYDKVGSVDPFANALWNSCVDEHKNNLISVNDEIVRMTLLPRCDGQFRRNGLIVNRLRYKNYDYKDRFLAGGDSVVVAYDPKNVGKVWLYENGEYVAFDLIEQFFNDMDLVTVNDYKDNKKLVEKAALKESLQSSIDLSREIELIANSINQVDVDMNNVRLHRENEIKKSGD